MRVVSLADAPVVRAVTLRRGLSAGLDRVRAAQAALVAREFAASIAECGHGGEITLDVDLEASTFSIVALPSGAGTRTECIISLTLAGGSVGSIKESEKPP